MLLGWCIVGLYFHVLVVEGDVEVADVGSGLSGVVGEAHHAEKNVHFEIGAMFILLAGGEGDDVVVVGFGFDFDGEGFLLGL